MKKRLALLVLVAVAVAYWRDAREFGKLIADVVGDEDAFGYGGFV